jgi:hypothetical protein
MEQNNINDSALYCGRPIEGQVFKGETFEIQKTERGILYHSYGGYSIFVTPRNNALYQTLDDLISYREKIKGLTEQEKNDFELVSTAIVYVLNAPRFAFSDQVFTLDLATFIINYLRSITEKADNAPLEYEQPDDVAPFLSVVESFDNIKTILTEQLEDAENQGESEGEGESETA